MPLVVFALIGWFTAATFASGDWTSRYYLLNPPAARTIAARALVDQDPCTICFSSAQGAMRWTRLAPNPAQAPHVTLVTAGRRVRVDVALDADDDGPGFGRVRVEFGDGGNVDWGGIVAAARFEHEYRDSGQFQVTVWLQLRNGRLQQERHTVDISAG